jgi:hypothetical protein
MYFDIKMDIEILITFLVTGREGGGVFYFYMYLFLGEGGDGYSLMTETQEEGG